MAVTPDLRQYELVSTNPVDFSVSAGNRDGQNLVLVRMLSASGVTYAQPLLSAKQVNEVIGMLTMCRDAAWPPITKPEN